MDIISTTDVEAYVGTAVTADVDPDALRIIVDLTNDLVSEAWSAAESTTVAVAPSWVTAIALETAARPVRNPRGLTSWTYSADDGSRTERLSDAAARTGVYLDEADETRLRRGVGTTKRRRFGTIRSGVGY